jgi:hypothetical protein
LPFRTGPGARACLRCGSGSRTQLARLMRPFSTTGAATRSDPRRFRPVFSCLKGKWPSHWPMGPCVLRAGLEPAISRLRAWRGCPFSLTEHGPRRPPKAGRATEQSGTQELNLAIPLYRSGPVDQLGRARERKVRVSSPTDRRARHGFSRPGAAPAAHLPRAENGGVGPRGVTRRRLSRPGAAPAARSPNRLSHPV